MNIITAEISAVILRGHAVFIAVMVILVIFSLVNGDQGISFALIADERDESIAHQR